MKGILLYLEKARRDTGRPIMVHQSRVKREQMSRIPESASILKGLRGWRSCWRVQCLFADTGRTEMHSLNTFVSILAGCRPQDNAAVRRGQSGADQGGIKWLHNIKERLESTNPYVLFTLGQQPFKNINRYPRMAWREMDLIGDINFTLIRTAVADCVSMAELSLVAYILR
ncbi:hypothetical protein XENOCAPTIV_014077 [Xenoophorus captivus]|uniref:Uncharacterized protein n=1 Tax=Xenoophorus captivus TaxID=1517983 RepID=A0ABV0QI98_9TELE